MMNQIAIVKDDPARLYASARSGLFATRDGGETWNGLSYGVARTLEGVVISVDPQDPDHIFAVLQDAGPEPKVSWDGGRTWDVVRTGMWQPGEFIPDMITDIRFSPTNSKIVLATIGPYECWLNNTCEQGLGRGIIRSQDGGQSWSTTNLSEGNISGLASSTDSTWYAAMYRGGFYRSDDDGQTWELVNSDPIPTSLQKNITDPDQAFSMGIITIESHPRNNDWIYSGILHGGFSFSQDGGKSWQTSSAGLPPEAMIADIAIDPSNPELIYAAIRERGVYFSQDGGETWLALNQGLTNRAAEHLTISNDGTVLYVATEGAGVFRLGIPPVSSHPTSVPTEKPDEEPIQQLEVSTPEIDQPDEPEEGQEGKSLLPRCLQSQIPIAFIGMFAFSRWLKKRRQRNEFI